MSVRLPIFGKKGVNDGITEGKNALMIAYIITLTIHERTTRNNGVRAKIYL
jgi:hypothetical protein